MAKRLALFASGTRISSERPRKMGESCAHNAIASYCLSPLSCRWQSVPGHFPRESFSVQSYSATRQQTLVTQSTSSRVAPSFSAAHQVSLKKCSCLFPFMYWHSNGIATWEWEQVVASVTSHATMKQYWKEIVSWALKEAAQRLQPHVPQCLLHLPTLHLI